MLVSWVACKLVFVAVLYGRFAFATEDNSRAVARGGRSVSFGCGCYAGFALRARVASGEGN